jgi:type VI secretion system protein ImpH
VSVSPRRRREVPTLLDTLRSEPHRFELFQAAQILQRLLARAATTNAATTGATSGVPARRPPALRFSSHQSLGFPVSELQAVEGLDGAAAEILLIVNIMGLTGALGALPQIYTELALKTRRTRNPAFSHFLDLFNDRLLHLFHRAWRRYRLPPLLETYGLSGTDPVRAILYAVAGLGQPSLRRRQTLEDEPLLFYAGLFGQMPKSAISLERLIGDFTGLPARVEQFRARRILLPPAEQTRLPAPGRAGQFHQLGVDAVVGEATLDVQGCFRIVLGPLSYAQFADYLPGNRAVRRLKDLVRTYVGPEFSYDIQLVLRRDQIPHCRLGGGVAPRLGWTTWAIALPALQDAGDAVFEADAVAEGG